MFDKVMLLIGPAANGQDELIELLIQQAKAYLMMFCNLETYDSKYDNLVIKMVIEDFNRRGMEGLQSQSFSGVSTTVNTDEPYSAIVMSQLKSYRRIRLL